MSNEVKSKLRNFHQAKWDEPIIFELSTAGELGVIMPEADAEIQASVGDGLDGIPDGMLRETPPALPELGQMQVLRHYLRLSQENLGNEQNVDVGQGTCTMKYNPKVNEHIARSTKQVWLHPDQDASTVQGTLQIIHKTDLFLRQISGMDAFTFQPRGGSQAILAMASIVYKYHERHGEAEQRDEIITTIFSHPADAAAAAAKGYKIITLYTNEQGYVELNALRVALSERTAALFITNPEDTGIFNPDIKKMTRLVHEAGGLCGYDQANANGILGITRAQDAEFDMCFFNLHKTFSVPHCCGGPAVGALGVTSQLRDYLPVPLVAENDGGYFLDYDMPHSFGKISGFYGVVPAVVRAYCWIMNLGARGLLEVARVAVLNNNYLLKKVREVRGASAPYATGKHRIEQVRFSWDKLHRDTGVATEDVTNRMADFGFHMWSSHHPFIVPNPFSLEPTESYSKAELDQYVAGLQRVSDEAYSEPETVKSAPHNSTVHKIDHSWFDDPKKWAITWRAYLRKHQPDSGQENS